MTAGRLADTIIDNYRNSVRRFRHDYLEKLTRSSQDFLDAFEGGELRTREGRQSLASSTRKLVDSVFHLLEPYARELNRVLGPGRLSISMTEPILTTETLKEDWPHRPSRKVQFYRARFASRVLSVSIRGGADRVDFFLLPVEQVMRLSDAEEEFGPLMSYETRPGDPSSLWWVEGRELSDERFERYTLLLFEHFIERTQEELTRLGQSAKKDRKPAIPGIASITIDSSDSFNL